MNRRRRSGRRDDLPPVNLQRTSRGDIDLVRQRALCGTRQSRASAGKSEAEIVEYLRDQHKDEENRQDGSAALRDNLLRRLWLFIRRRPHLREIGHGVCDVVGDFRNRTRERLILISQVELLKTQTQRGCTPPHVPERITHYPKRNRATATPLI